MNLLESPSSWAEWVEILDLGNVFKDWKQSPSSSAEWVEMTAPLRPTSDIAVSVLVGGVG